MARPPPRMQDPASGVPPQLLPHMHLVSNYRYPLVPSLSTEMAVDYLISAPKIVRELQPMRWMFLDGPPDGSLLLVWQPLNHLGTNFASDGYVWADVEQIYTTEAKGYTVEVWLHRCGYHPPNETVATHARRRYRLMPSKTPNPNLPPADPSLWIVHYGKAPSIDQLPANRIPVVPQVQNILAQRRFLQSQGQLARRDFMLHDRNNWPTISLPAHVGHVAHQPSHPSYPLGHPHAPQIARQQPGIAYPQQQVGPMVGAPPRQPRTQRASMTAAGSGPAMDHGLEDEDTTSGDILDAITPRDISRMRYRNHHEWMEEIFSSPYRISQIAPVDLGLGRKGELEPITASFFHTPSTAQEASPLAAKLEPAKVEEFTDVMNRKISEMTADMEAMRKKHAQRLEKIRKLSTLKDGELKLRDAFVDPSDTGAEFWRLEGRLQLNKEDGAEQMEYEDLRPKLKVDDIVREVQTAQAATISTIAEVVCLEKGGLQERVRPQPVKPTETAVPTTTDVDMADSSAVSGVPQQQPSGVSAPEPTGQPQPPALGQVGQAQDQAQAPSTDVAAPPQTTIEPKADVEMGGMQEAAAAPTGADQDSGDWVIVNKEENVPEETKPGEETAPAVGEGLETTATSTPGKGLEGLTPGSNLEGVLESSNFDDVSGFNTAGEALAAYGDDQNDGLDLGGLDNSAFGDAFHAPEGDQDHIHHDTDDIP